MDSPADRGVIRAAPREPRRGQSLDPADFRRAVGRFATGVTVLTTIADGRHLGMTANSFVSVSLDPLLVLASIRRDARFHDPVIAAGVWGVSVLAEDMIEASRFFAKRAYDDPGLMFEGWDHAIGGETGVVLLERALSVFECRTVSTYPGGDHTLLVGEVVSFAQPREDAGPLVFYNGGYLGPAGPVVASGPNGSASPGGPIGLGPAAGADAALPTTGASQ